MAAAAAEFLLVEAARGRRLAVHHAPAGAVRGVVLHVHAFAEEMNKSRRMAALQARAFAAAGFAVLQLDLYGCGDSSGDFDDADWPCWIDDVVLGCGWLQQRYPALPLVLWGVRAGCLLACAAAPRLDRPACALFWQPPAQGAQVLQQFLRLAAAGELLRGDAKGAAQRLKQQLAAGETVEIAGYALGAGLAAGLERATLAPWPQARAAAWFEVTPRADATLSPALEAAARRWADAGVAPRTAVAPGTAFWQSTEIELAPALLAASTAAAQQLVAA